jgi:hypothetical protein
MSKGKSEKQYIKKMVELYNKTCLSIINNHMKVSEETAENNVIEINETLQVMFIDLLNQKQAIEQRITQEMNVIVHALNRHVEGANLMLSRDLKSIEIILPEKLPAEK